MISKVPKTSRDAQLFCAASPPPPPQAPSDNDPDPDPHPLQPPAHQPAVQYAHVIEVLKDNVADLSPWLEAPDESSAWRGQQGQRRGNARKRRKRRTQRWAPFVVSSDGLTLLDAFPGMVAGAKGRSAAVMDASGQKEMHIVKQFPFGRRI